MRQINSGPPCINEIAAAALAVLAQGFPVITAHADLAEVLDRRFALTVKERRRRDGTYRLSLVRGSDDFYHAQEVFEGCMRLEVNA